MRILRSALIYTLLFAAIFTLVVKAQDENRASKTWEVQKYDIVATLPQNEADRNVSIKANLTLKNASGAAASTLTLRISQSADVSGVLVNDSATEFSKREEKISSAVSLQRIIVRLSPVPANSVLKIEVAYKLNVKENSGLSSVSENGSQFLPLSFWYPTPNSWYFARGADFAPFNLNVVTGNAANMEVISSGDGFASATGSKSFSEKLNGQPFFVTGSWDSFKSNGIEVYLPKGANPEQKKRGEDIALYVSEVKTFVENLLGPAPNVPFKVVSVKLGAGYSGGGTVFVEDGIFRRQKIDAHSALAIAESVAKVWLGNAALIDGDGYGTIREGLSRHIANEFIESKFGRETAEVERMRQRVAYSAAAKRDSPLRISSPLDDYYYASVANKGAMVWRLVSVKFGTENFYKIVRGQVAEKYINLSKLRAALSAQKTLLDYQFDEVLDMNLLVGLPIVVNGETKSAVRNTGAIEATVDVVATTSTGERLKTKVTIPPAGFGEALFKIPGKITQTEIDADKLYPQTDYGDDIVPRSSEEVDVLVGIKRAFDKQTFASAEQSARAAVIKSPGFDEARVWLARAYLAQNKITDAEREFSGVLTGTLPTSQSIAWANVGLGEIASRLGNKDQALKYFTEAIMSEADYGASLAARIGRKKIVAFEPTDETVKTFFTNFDKAAVSGRKIDLDSLIVSGDLTRFSGGVAGAQIWQTKVLFADLVDTNTILAEVELNIRLLNREVESGFAVFRLTKSGNAWKLSKVEMFEVR